jgi:hypothetical protein
MTCAKLEKVFSSETLMIFWKSRTFDFYFS